MKKIFMPVILILCAFLIEGSFAQAQGLDRETAAQIIRQHGLPAVEFKVPIGDEVNIKTLISSTSAANLHYGRQLDASYGCLTRMGYLDATINRRSPLRNYRVSLTEKSSLIGASYHEKYLGYGEVFVFKAADRVLHRVTGIKQTSNGSSTVSFEYRWDNFTDILDCLVKGFKNEPQSANAIFGLYDDGWRIESTTLDDVGPM